MNKQLPQSPVFIYIPISKLSWYSFCPKRTQIALFKKRDIIETESSREAMRKGIQIHHYLALPYKSFDRILVRYRLGKYMNKVNGRYVFHKQVGKTNIILVGMYDDLRVIKERDGKKYTILIEYKSTSKKYMWNVEIRAAVKQLQLYMYLLKEYLEEIKFPLWKRGYVEIYQQKKGLIKVVPVEYDDNIETWIKQVVESLQGLRGMKPPETVKICKFCPREIRTICPWHVELKKREKTW